MDTSNHRRHEHHLRKRVPVPAPVAEPQQQDAGGTMTVVEVVFVTQAPTFEGDAAGLVTLNAVDEPTSTRGSPSPTAKPTSKKETVVGDDTEAEQTQTTFRKSTKSISQTSTIETTSFSTPTASRTSTLRSSTATLDSANSSGSSSGSSASDNSSGMTITTYAGIVGGSVGAILILIVVIAVMMKRRKKNSNYEKPEDEKDLNRLSFNDRAPASPVPMPTPMAPAVAPKLQIRPMTQFDSSFFPSGTDNTLKHEEKPVRAPPPALSLENNKKHLGLGPFDTPEPSPAMSAFSDNSNMSLPIQGAANSAPSTVHRILVDFKPSMADELELNAGEFVRLLHEYDDGWALCIRMDRTRQGVCPRTCLSPRPAKPRPPPGSRGPPPPPPQSPGGRPQSPGMGPGSRPQSPRSPGPNRPPMSPKGMPGPPRRPGGPDSRPSSPTSNRQPHPLSKVQRDDDLQFHAM